MKPRHPLQHCLPALLAGVLLTSGLLLSACGREDGPAGAGAPEGVGAGGLAPDEILVPLSGSDPTHVVGAVGFNRFHLLTLKDGFRAAAPKADDAEARALYTAGRYRPAARAFTHAAERARKGGQMRAEEGARQRALACHALLDEPVEMLDDLKRLLELQAARTDGLPVARSRADLGCVYGMLANHARALDHLVAAGAAFRRYGMKRSVAHTYACQGLVYLRRAEYGPALDVLEEARELLGKSRNRTLGAYVLVLLGGVHEQVGDLRRATALYEQALALHGKDESIDVGDLLGNLGNVHVASGDEEAALRDYEAARRIFEAHQDYAGTANALFSMGRVQKIQGAYATALEFYRRALTLQESDSAAAARTLGAIAETHLAMGRPDDALAEVEQALENMDPASARAVRVELLVVHALVSLRKGDTQRAVQQIRRALDLLMDIAAGLADEHVVGLREHSAWAFAAGLALALKTGRVDLATEFLEHGRAGALLEGLGGRGARRGLPADLVEAETRASHRLAAANREYQSARANRRIKGLRAASAHLREAQSAYRTLQQRIQREAKRLASVFHPVPDSLADIRSALRPNEVLVLYALLPFQAHALIVTREDARIQWIGNTQDISRACEALRVDAPEEEGGTDAEVMARVTGLRRMVLDPLRLPAGTKRLLLSPDGPLCYVPFPLLVQDPGLAITCLPSGTTLRLLAGERARTGEGVLALGDPDYLLEHHGRSLQVYAQGAPLEPLPATRKEVVSITGASDVRLLGPYATVRNLSEMAATRARWSVIHLACHGLIDPRMPTLSALAITPEEGDDGFLTALEVYGMHLPADLIVLSGCNTGRGRFVKGEGLVGLMRAFMCAGAPRIVVSLWKVDDEATQALMTRFHHLWRTTGQPTSSALRQAQREIAAQPKWHHPRFWAAWVLWGLVD